ncbi:DUF4037 domain-containing protein [Streptosporangium sandarakinum]|uniref:DUF4037 domain-containing protein n=1 Tax=Streptosporangium sandarakinum TaxID=1260955 RepID=A0A852V6S8_9ACTN|nr:DUF4037 domain-containing protein [Streptosporangium sandarakinum]NYF41715.1 hypothetical protein [Streptosporangium sandarakinum]
MMFDFVPGLPLSRGFYEQVAGPALAGVPHAAALLGEGSEVLSFDTPASAGPRHGVRLVVLTGPGQSEAVRATLGHALPPSYGGRPVTLGTGGVEVAETGAWLVARLGFDPLRPIGPLDWLAVPWQRLAGTCGGEVFRDDAGLLGRARQALRRYPPDVERYVLAAQWRRLAAGYGHAARCSEVGDELGAAALTAGLARDLMRLALLTRRRWPPYDRWLGSAFARLPGAAETADALAAALATGDRSLRRDHLRRAWRQVAALRERSPAAPPGTATATGTATTAGRRSPAEEAEGLAETFTAAITDPRVRALPPGGSIDQLTGSAEVLTDPARCRALTRAALGL